MIKRKLGVAAGVFLAASLANVGANAGTNTDDSLFQQSQSTDLLGQRVGGAFETGAVSSSHQLVHNSTVTLLGKDLNPIQVIVTPPSSADATGEIDIYSFGKKIYSHSGDINGNVLSKTVSIPPIEASVPFVTYPVGPVLLQINGGAGFQADLKAALGVSGNILHPSVQTVDASITGKGVADGFVSGTATLVAVRAGVEGELDLVDAQAQAKVTYLLSDLSTYSRSLSAMVQFLNGRVYGFASVLNGTWKKIISKDFYKWNGTCYAVGDKACPTK